MKLWKRKLRGLLLAGLFAAHTFAGGPLLPDLPRPVEPLVGRDWGRHEPFDAVGTDPTWNSAPRASAWGDGNRNGGTWTVL